MTRSEIPSNIFALMKNIHFAVIWFAATTWTLLFALLFLINLTYPRIVPTPNGLNYRMYKALPSSLPDLNGQETSISKGDGRTVIVANFFRQRKSPLADFAETFIQVADEQKLDYRLMPSIAMQESNGGRILPKDSFNPFGYGIYGGKVLRFASFEEAIETVGAGLKKNYISQGLNTPQEIMVKYTPPSLAKGGAWAIGVSAFMEQLQ